MRRPCSTGGSVPADLAAAGVTQAAVAPGRPGSRRAVVGMAA